MKYLHVVVCIVMVLFALLQWNDPDRLLWMGIYTVTAVTAFLAYRQYCSQCVLTICILILLICLYMMMNLLPGMLNYFQAAEFNEIFSNMQEDKAYIEETREFIGLLLVSLYSIFTAYKNYNH